MFSMNIRIQNHPIPNLTILDVYCKRLRLENRHVMIKYLKLKILLLEKLFYISNSASLICTQYLV